MNSKGTKIEVLLTEAARNVLGTEWITLDIDDDFSLSEYKDLEGLSDLNQILLEAVLGFSVKFSTVNDLAMMPFDSPAIVDNRTVWVECRVSIWGDPRPFDRIYFKEKNYTSGNWELEFQRSSQHWAELAGKKTLCSLNLGITPFDKDTIEASWNDLEDTTQGGVWNPDKPGILWALADYGAWVDQAEPAQLTDSPVKRVRVEDFRPFLSKLWLLQQGFCEIGWTLAGPILETAWFRRHWDYLLSPTFYKVSKGGDFKLVGRHLSDDTDLQHETTFIDAIDYDPGGNAIIAGGSIAYPGIINNTGYEMCFRFRFQGVIENTGLTQTIHSTLVPMLPSAGPNPWIITGEILAETFTEILAGENLQVDIQMELNIKPGDAVAMFPAWGDQGVLSNIGLTAKKGYYITIEPCQQTLIRGDVVNIADMIDCNYTLLDYLKGAVHEFNGKFYTDWDTHTVWVFPENDAMAVGEPVDGFLRRDEQPIDIHARVVCNSVRMKPIRNNLTRYSRLQWKESTDAHIESLNLQEPLYSRKVLNDLTLQDKITELSNPFFEPTAEGQPEGLANVLIGVGSPIPINVPTPVPFLPRLWDNTDGNMSYNIGPRTMLAFGNAMRQINPSATSIGNTYAAVYFEDEALFYFGYLSHKPTWAIDSVFASGPEYAVDPLIYGNAASDLFVTYWLQAGLLRKRGSDLDVLVFMGQREYSNWDFRTPFTFRLDGFPLQLLLYKVRDFRATLEIPTPLNFVVEPIETACCDFPCSCRFTQCDMYQDMGQYILQDTLNDLFISSFKVDNVEQITAPVSLGIVNMINLAGKPYVTNLVDALNSLGVPYFTFAYSTRDFEEKGDWRFFTIEFPACQSFEIIISDGDGEVYRYTNTETQQQWFGGSWSPFSYSGTDFGEPLGCTTIVKY